MTEHKVGTREEWQTARDELAGLEAEHAELGQKVADKRRELPWIPVDDGVRVRHRGGEKKTLAGLFDGRSQLLAYNIMFGPDFEVGACPGCSNLGDELDATCVHLNHHYVTLICFSRAPIDRLTAYKERMGWTFPYVSTYGSDFAFDFGLAINARAGRPDPRGEGDGRRTRPGGSRTGRGRSVRTSRTACERTRASLPSSGRTGPSTTRTRCSAPDPFVAPYHYFLLDRTPKPPPEEPRAVVKTSIPTPSAVFHDQ